MIRVDLKNETAWDAVNWLYRTLGPSGERWILNKLAYVEFRKDRDATLFLTAWG